MDTPITGNNGSGFRPQQQRHSTSHMQHGLVRSKTQVNVGGFRSLKRKKRTCYSHEEAPSSTAAPSMDFEMEGEPLRRKRYVSPKSATASPATSKSLREFDSVVHGQEDAVFQPRKRSRLTPQELESSVPPISPGLHASNGTGRALAQEDDTRVAQDLPQALSQLRQDYHMTVERMLASQHKCQNEMFVEFQNAIAQQQDSNDRTVDKLMAAQAETVQSSGAQVRAVVEEMTMWREASAAQHRELVQCNVAQQQELLRTLQRIVPPQGGPAQQAAPRLPQAHHAAAAATALVKIDTRKTDSLSS